MPARPSCFGCILTVFLKQFEISFNFAKAALGSVTINLLEDKFCRTGVSVFCHQ